MGQTHIQTRVPNNLADRIEHYQENESYMNQAEALRALLREGLASEGYGDGESADHTKTEPEDRFGSVWRAAGWISHISLGLYVGVVLNLVAAAAGIVTMTPFFAVLVVVGTLLAVGGTILSLVLTAIHIGFSEEPTHFGRLDLRRVIT